MDILTTVDVREEIKKSQQREINEMNRPGKETVLAVGLLPLHVQQMVGTNH
jgi:hypothetical protein